MMLPSRPPKELLKTFVAGSTCRKSDVRSGATYRCERPLLLLKITYARPSSSVKIDWSPDMPVETFAMLDCVPARVKWPFGVLLVANTSPASSWETSTNLPVLELRATPTRPTQPAPLRSAAVSALPSNFQFCRSVEE